MTEEEMRALLGEAAKALADVGKAALTVKPTLDEPYRDNPQWTPWRLFMRDPSKRAYNLGVQIRKRLRESDHG